VVVLTNQDRLQPGTEVEAVYAEETA